MDRTKFRNQVITAVLAVAMFGGLAFFVLRGIARISAPVLTELRVANATDVPIAFYTDHTKQTVTIAPHATALVPHTCGTLTITNEAGPVWNYETVDVTAPKFRARAIIGQRRLTVPITVGPNGNLLLQSGAEVAPLTRQEFLRFGAPSGELSGPEISNLVRVASGLRVGTPEGQVYEYVNKHGLDQSNMMIYSMSVDRGRTWISPFHFRDGACELVLHFQCTQLTPGGWSNALLTGASIDRQGVRLTATNAP